MEIRIIDRAHKEDINIPNQPFPLYGRMVPSYFNGKWDYKTQLFPEQSVTQICFPDENYDYDAMKEDCVFIGAYQGEACIGLAILQDHWARYMYLYDLKVNQNYRGKGVAAALVERMKAVSRERGYRGIYTVGQDNNLSACKFYLKSGFHIGGLNTDVYIGTRQEGKSNIYFYMDV